jgi:phosphate starvation-inducible protein PhoH
MNQIKEVAMPLDNALQQAELFGSGDEYIRFIEEKFGVSVVYRNDTMKFPVRRNKSTKQRKRSNRCCLC